ncbi:hypothetical protein B0H34DRAFT_701089 [Crassisporium funariophilum]|nr:hypothetical protein B0H34DRAFT_701089 [Crassisporium funariophilum]
MMDSNSTPINPTFVGDPSALPRVEVPETEPEPEVKRDDVYYFDTIVLKVENTLFKVPRKGFESGQNAFTTLFTLPPPEGARAEGADDALPISLHGISKAHFRAFLLVLYPINGTASTYEEWVDALDLATMWEFKEVRNKSVAALTELMKSRNIAENILLAKKYHVEQWLRDGYIRLVTQEEPLEIDELCSSMLDLLTIARLLSIREKVYARSSRADCDDGSFYCNRCGDHHAITCPSFYKRIYNIKDADANDLVSQVFAEEIRGMQAEH